MISNEMIRAAVADKRKVKDCGKSLFDVIQRTAVLGGKKLSREDVMLSAKELSKKVSASFKEMTFNELAMVLEEGIYGGFGEVYSLTVVVMFQWVQDYFSHYHKERQDAVANYNLLALPPSGQMTDEAVMQQWGANVQKLFDDFCKDPENLYHRPTGLRAGAAAFGFLVKSGVELFADETFMAQVRQNVESQKVRFINYHVKAVNSGLYNAAKGGKKEPIDENFILDLAVKTEAVKEYFSYLAANGMSLFAA